MKFHWEGEIPDITVKLCSEDRARLDNIIELLKGGTSCHCSAPAVTEPEAPKAAPVKAEPAKEAPKPAEPENLPPAPEKAKEAPKNEAPEVSTAELQSKVVQLVSAGKKEAARAIITEYAARVGEIPADKRSEVMARLKALEG